MQAKIVVGLGYGDEGKGAFTNYLCNYEVDNSDVIVVRHSGGQQAGHTVMNAYHKHIHSNFASGAIDGLPSYFSEHTTIYPTTISREYRELLDKTPFMPSLVIHPFAKLTTPFDIDANQKDVENLNHGTCGLGVGKTMKRNESPYKLYAMDLKNIDVLWRKIKSIAIGYYGLLKNEITDDIDQYMNAVMRIRERVHIDGYDYLKAYSNVIFEGSQGVLLDMDHGEFPNVTYANTTSKNAFDVIKKIGGVDRVDSYNITRAYHTRHGNGYFKEDGLSLVSNDNEINIENKYQGKFRVSKIDYDLLNYAIYVEHFYSGHSNSTNLVVTCLDQVDYNFDFSKLEGGYYDNHYTVSSPIYDRNSVIKIENINGITMENAAW